MAATGKRKKKDSGKVKDARLRGGGRYKLKGNVNGAELNLAATRSKEMSRCGECEAREALDRLSRQHACSTAGNNASR